jgi:diguanylate cyclase (GGDEF)-like protein
MTLTRKTGLTLLLAFAIVLLLQIFLSRQLLLAHVVRIEQEQLQRTVHLLIDRISSEREHIRTQSMDWGQWDDMYDYLLRKYPDFEQANFTIATHDYTNTNVLAVFDLNHQLYHGQRWESGDSALQPLSDDFVAALQMPLASLVGTESLGTVIQIQQAFYLVGISPVLTSAQEGPPRGHVVFARRLSIDIAASLLAKTNAILQFDTKIPLTHDATPKLEQDSIHYHVTASHIDAEAFIGDWQGRATMRLSLFTPREIYHQALSAHRYGLLFSSTAFILILVVLFFSLRKLVLNRLIDLRNHLKTVAREGEKALRLPVNNNDELSDVNHSINDMLDALAFSKDSERRNSQLIRERLETLTQLTWSVAMQPEYDDVIWPDILTACSRHFADSYSAIYLLDENRVQLRLQHANYNNWNATVSCNTAPERWDDIFEGRRTTILIDANHWPQFSDDAGQLLIAAIAVKKQLVGIMVLMHHSHSWRDSEGDFVASLAKIAGQAMARRADNKAAHEWRMKAQTDALTGLANRAALDEHLDYVLHRVRTKQQISAVLFIDLDGFKPINDDLGHAAGDRVLIQLGFRLQKMMRTNDMVARVGGDEFVVVLDQIHDADIAITIAKKIRDRINEPVQLPEQNVQLGCSIGIALFPEHALNSARLLAHADEAMYQAKKSGKNAVRLWGAAE